MFMKNGNYELKAVDAYVLLRLLDGNPFRKTESEGLLIATAEELNDMNDADKEMEGFINKLEQEIVCGLILSCGPKTLEAKPNDIVYVSKHTLTPIPFYNGVDQIVYKIHETQLLGLVSVIEEDEVDIETNNV